MKSLFCYQRTFDEDAIAIVFYSKNIEFEAIMLRHIADNLWVAEQPLKFLGLEVGTRMTVVKLSDNSLVLISPIYLDFDTSQQLNSWGTVKYLVAPNLFHYLYIDSTQQVYPQAVTLSAPGLANKQPDLHIDRELTQDIAEFGSELEYILLDGFQVFVPPKIAVVNEVVFYHPASKTLIITDSAFNFDSTFPLVTRLAARVIDSYQTLKPSWLEKIAVKEKEKIARSIEQVLIWDFQRVIMAHGKIVENNAKEQLLAGYRWLIS